MPKRPTVIDNPARRIIAACGGIPVVVKITGHDRTWVWRWTQPKSAGGTDGRIPPKDFEKILAWAQRTKAPVTADMAFRRPAASRPVRRQLRRVGSVSSPG